ncbi:MAG: ABC transporter permease [Jatrophihabitantaceae bacterium]
MAGLVIAGPWLTMLGSRLMARRATRPATLIAGRRLADNPQAGFRAISGLVLAVFVGTCALGVITTVVAYDGGTVGVAALARGTLVDTFRQGPDHNTMLTPADTATLNRLSAVPGVTGVATIHVASGGVSYLRNGQQFGPLPDVVSCAQLAAIPALGRCPQGAHAVTISPDYGGAIVERSRATMANTTWPAARLTPSRVQRLPLDSIVVATDGSVAAVERARTILDNAYVQTYAAQTLNEIRANGAQKLNGYKQLANVIILTSLPIAGCSLAISVAGGLAERKRPFSLLRLAGAPLGLLRRVITLEAAGPLIISAVVSAGAGLLTAQLFLRAQLYETLQPPSVQYYLVIIGGLVAPLAVIASTLPFLGRITGPETARND